MGRRLKAGMCLSPECNRPWDDQTVLGKGSRHSILALSRLDKCPDMEMTSSVFECIHSELVTLVKS